MSTKVFRVPEFLSRTYLLMRPGCAASICDQSLTFPEKMSQTCCLLKEVDAARAGDPMIAIPSSPTTYSVAALFKSLSFSRDALLLAASELSPFIDSAAGSLVEAMASSALPSARSLNPVQDPCD